jgi:hypothetical protein
MCIKAPLTIDIAQITNKGNITFFTPAKPNFGKGLDIQYPTTTKPKISAVEPNIAREYKINVLAKESSPIPPNPLPIVGKITTKNKIVCNIKPKLSNIQLD